MKKNYDFTGAIRNPYAKRLKKQLTIRLDTDTVDYFQELSRELSLPYQTLMNMYLRDCATTRRRPEWAAPRKGARPNQALQRTTTLPRSARSPGRR
jgi:antitoxin component of RelBE/YafQ-DinJ toxin-antitoxin module